jgi:hypothetical protein
VKWKTFGILYLMFKEMSDERTTHRVEFKVGGKKLKDRKRGIRKIENVCTA